MGACYWDEGRETGLKILILCWAVQWHHSQYRISVETVPNRFWWRLSYPFVSRRQAATEENMQRSPCDAERSITPNSEENTQYRVPLKRRKMYIRVSFGSKWGRWLLVPFPPFFAILSASMIEQKFSFCSNALRVAIQEGKESLWTW